MTEGTANWTSYNLANFSLSGDHLKAYGNSDGEYFHLAAGYAPMVAGEDYEMTLYATANLWYGTGWTFKDYGGRALALTSDTPTGDYPGNFDVKSRPVNAVYKFTAPAGTSGGFRVCSIGEAEVQFFDNFLLVNTVAKAVVVGMVFKVTSTGDTTDNALAIAKSSAPAANDLFAVTSITTTGSEIMADSKDRDFTGGSTNWANGDLGGSFDDTTDLSLLATVAAQYCTCVVAGMPMTAGTAYRIQCDVSGLVGTWTIQDFTGAQELGEITADGDEQTFDFQMDTGLTGGVRFVAGTTTAAGNFDNFSLKAGEGEVTYVGNNVGSYAWSAASTTSALTQTAANRTTAGINVKGKASKEYQLTYTIAIKEAIAPVGALAVTMETFGTSTTMPITAGNHAIYFQSASDAATAAFVIQSESSSAMTAGILAISNLTLMRCCDSTVNPDATEWVMIRPLEADATFSAVASTGDDLTSMTLAVLESDSTIRGRWSRIIPTSGRIAAYRL